MRLVSPPNSAPVLSGDNARSHALVFAPKSQDPTQPGIATRGQAASGGHAVDTNLLGRTSLGLIVIIGVILLCGYLLKRIGPYRNQTSKSLALVASQSIGHRERVVIMDIEDQRLVLGVTANNINKLHELTAPAPDMRPAERRAPSLGEAFARNLREASARFATRSRS